MGNATRPAAAGGCQDPVTSRNTGGRQTSHSVPAFELETGATTSGHAPLTVYAVDERDGEIVLTTQG